MGEVDSEYAVCFSGKWKRTFIAVNALNFSVRYLELELKEGRLLQKKIKERSRLWRASNDEKLRNDNHMTLQLKGDVSYIIYVPFYVSCNDFLTSCHCVYMLERSFMELCFFLLSHVVWDNNLGQ